MLPSLSLEPLPLKLSVSPTSPLAGPLMTAVGGR